ncbi:cytochrome c [Photobacterium sp. DNB22_13_2]
MIKVQKNSLMLGLGLGLTLTHSIAAVAADMIEAVNTQKTVELTTAEAISMRQSAFELIEQDAKLAGKALKAKEVNWDNLKPTTKKMYEASTRLESLFPEGSLEGSKAKDKVWKDRARFEQLLNEMDDGFVQLYQATMKEDKAAAQQGLKQAQSTCKACHRQYRSRW